MRPFKFIKTVSGKYAEALYVIQSKAETFGSRFAFKNFTADVSRAVVFVNKVGEMIWDLCFPRTDLIQALPTSTDTSLVDTINGYDVDFVNATAFDFNGTDNYVPLGYISEFTTQELNLHLTINKTVTGASSRFKYIYSCLNTGTKSGWGIRWGNSNDYINFIYVNSSGTLVAIDISGAASTGINEIEVNITELNVQCIINGVETNTAKTAILYDSEPSYIGAYNTALTITGFGVDEYINLNIYNTTKSVSIPFVQKYGVAMNTVSDVNSDTPYTMAGTVTTVQTVKQSDYFYFQNEGFTDDGTNYIPASQLNAGLDVLGNTLTNPAIENGLNGGCDINYPDVAALKAIDVSNIFYDVGGNPRDLSIADLPQNSYNKIFWNTDNSTFAKQGLAYTSEQSSEKIDLIELCYARANS